MTRPAAGIAFCICCLNLLRSGFSQSVIAGLVTVLVISLGYDLAKDIYYRLTAWFEKKAIEEAERMAERKKPNTIYVEDDAGHNREWVCKSATEINAYDMCESYYQQLEYMQKELIRRQIEHENN